MKKLFYSLFLLIAFTTVGLAQSQCVDVEEIDGSPKAPCIKVLKVTNGTLSCPTVNRCTLTISGGGGTPGGSTTQVQYNNAGAFGGISGLSTNGSTTLTQTSASATAFVSGLNGATTPAFVIDNSTASQASGMKVIGKADGTAPEILSLSRTQITTALAGNGLSITADPAIAGSSVAGAAAGGTVTYKSGNAARLTSGSAAGGDHLFLLGTGIGTGREGLFQLGGNASGFPALGRRSGSGQFEVTVGDNSTRSVMWSGGIVASAATPGTFTGGAYLNSSGINFASNSVAQFSSTTDAVTPSSDLFFRRGGVANLAFGAADAASPVAQTQSVQNVVAGTSNTAGVNWTHNASIGTGTGVGGDYIVQTAPAGSTGTAQNSLAAAFTVKGNGAVQLKSVTFTNLPTVANGYLIYCSDCTLASPCASGGTGALAKGINSAWVCN